MPSSEPNAMLSFELEGLKAGRLVRFLGHEAANAGIDFRATKIGGWILKHYVVTAQGPQSVIAAFGDYVRSLVEMNGG